MKKVYVHKGALIRKVTEEEAVRLKARGFKVLEAPAAKEAEKADAEETGHENGLTSALEKLKKAELEALAAEKGIEIPEKATKEEIIKLLEVSEE